MTEDCITTKKLKIVDDNGKGVATLEATANGAGLWITGPDGQTVAIYSIEGQTALGIYEKGFGDGKGMDLAIYMADGVPTVQYRENGGEVKFLKLSEVSEACKQ